MKIPNNKKFQQKTFNYSSDIEFQDFMNIYKNVLQNHIIFRLLMLLLHQIILHDAIIGDEKLQYDINREAAKVSA